MTTNPDNVGGLPELPEPAKRPFYFCNKCGHMGEVGPSHVRTDGTACDYHAATQGSFYTEEQMRAYGELCRAAPAGSGEVEALASRLVSMSNGLHSAHLCTDLRRAAALLRKFQQGDKP